MVRFFFVFLGLQLTLFGLNMLSWVQKHLVEPWTALLAQICAFLVTWFDKSAVAEGKVLWNHATNFGVSIEAASSDLPPSWLHVLHDEFVFISLTIFIL